MAGLIKTTWTGLKDRVALAAKALTQRDPLKAFLAADDVDLSRHVTNPLRQAVYVYTAVAAIARAVSRTEVQVVNRSTQKPVPDGDESDAILRQPNMLESLDAFFERTVLLRYRDGMVYWVMPKSAIPGMRPVIEIAKKSEVQPRKAGGMIAGWTWRPSGTGTPVELELDQVCRLYFPDPDDKMDALAPMEVAQLSADQHVFASKFGASVFLNGAHIGVTFKTDKSLTPEQRQQIIDEIRSGWSGFINAGKPLVLWGGLGAEPPPQTMNDLDMTGFKEQVRSEQIAPMFVPPMYAGIYADATFNNTRQQELFFWDMTGLSELGFLLNAWNAFVQPVVNPANEVQIVETSVYALKERDVEFTDKALGLQKHFIPLNVIIDAYGLKIPKQPWGDVPLVSPGLVPITMVFDEAAALAAQDNAPEGGTPGDENSQNAAWDAVVKAAESADIKAKRDAIHRRWWASFAKLRAQARGSYRAFIRRQRDEVLRRLEAAGLPDFGKASTKQTRQQWLDQVLLNLALEDGRLQLVSQFIFREAAQFGGEQAAREVGAEAFQFSLDNTRIRRHLESQALRIRRVNAVTNRVIRRVLLNGLDNGDTLQQISASLAKAMNVRADHQTLRIAHTEIGEAVSAGRMEGFRQVGIKKKSWLTSGRGVEPGGPVRKSHFGAEIATRAEPIPAGGKFRLVDAEGGESFCEYPLQGTLPAKERINCQCMVLAVEDTSGRALGLDYYATVKFMTYAAWQAERAAREKASA